MQKNNRTVNAILARSLKPQAVSAQLANKIFDEALSFELAKWQGVLSFEYTALGVPENGKQIYKMFNEAMDGKASFKVFNGANEASNLYFSPSVNLKYRAIHDLDHALQYQLGKGTTKLKDERFLNCLMAKRAYDYAISNSYTLAQSLAAFFAVYHDTVGQVDYYAKHKDFCVNQKANTEQLIKDCKGCQALENGLVSTAYNVMQSYLIKCDVK